MLVNGITLGYNKTATSSYTILKTLKEVPDLGTEPELVENTTIDAKNKQYEIGVGDAGDLEFKFKYQENKTATETRTILEMSDAGKAVNWQLTLPDGTKFNFKGTPSARLTAGAINSTLDLVVKIAIESDIDRIDPS